MSSSSSQQQQQKQLPPPQQQQQQSQQPQPQSQSWLSSLFGYILSKLQNWLSVWPEGSDLTMVMYDDDGKGEDIFYKDILAYDDIHTEDEYSHSSSGPSSSSSNNNSNSGNRKTTGGDDDDDEDGEWIRKRIPKFLGRYSEKEVRRLFEEFRFNSGSHKGMNFNELFTKLGFDPSHLVFDISDADMDVSGITMYDTSKTPDKLVAQLYINKTRRFGIAKSKMLNSLQSSAGVAMSWLPSFYREGLAQGCEYFRSYKFHPRPQVPDDTAELDLVHIEWLRFQNPRKKGESTSYLPGQLSPGLGIVKEMHMLLEELCVKNNRDGVINNPEYFYNALMYSSFTQWPYKFLNPAFEGFFQSMKQALFQEIQTRGLAKVAWAINFGAVRCAVFDSLEAARKFDSTTEAPDYVTVKWETQEQGYAITQRFKSYFESSGYKKLVKEYTLPQLFSIDSKKILDAVKLEL